MLLAARLIVMEEQFIISRPLERRFNNLPRQTKLICPDRGFVKFIFFIFFGFMLHEKDLSIQVIQKYIRVAEESYHYAQKHSFNKRMVGVSENSAKDLISAAL